MESNSDLQGYPTPTSHSALERRTFFERVCGLAMILWAKFVSASLVNSSPPKMPLTTFPKDRKKMPCVKTPSDFTSVKVKIYFQPPFPCPVIYRMTQKHSQIPPLISSHLWQTASWGLPKHCSCEGSAKALKAPPHTYPSFQMVCLRASAALIPMQSLHAEDNRELHNATRTLFFFFLLGFQLDTLPRNDIPFEL